MKRKILKKVVKRKLKPKHNSGHARKEVLELKERLREAHETLEAIRGGGVDAVVVSGPAGSQIYTLTGADQPYRVYVERMQEGAATVSSDGLILYANQRLADMVNQPLGRVISSDFSTFLSHAAWKKISGVFKNQDEVVKFETLLQPQGKPSLPVNLTASFLPLVGHTVLCLVVTDLSAQKLNEELRLAKEVAEKANAAKDAFIAALSHELRTPLNPILLLASDSALDTTLPEHIRDEFATIRDNIELEARLIDDLLDLNRIIRGKLTLQKSRINCLAVLKLALSMVEPDLKRKKISLFTDFPENKCEFFADGTRLQQVFWNILKNAVKFTPDHGRIRISAGLDASAGMLTLSVSDTGIGMAPEELPQIFEAFVQGHHAGRNGSHQFGGLGLGLAITRALIKMHDGTITAASDGLGKGSTFTIKLPVKAGASNGSRSVLPAAASESRIHSVQ